MRFLLICLILSSVLNAFECLLSEPFPDDDEFTDNEELVKDVDDPLIHESRTTDEKTTGAFRSVNRSIGEKISKGFKKGTGRVKGSVGNTDSLSSSAQKNTRDLKTRSVSKRKTKDTSGKKTRKFISEANSSIGKKITKVYSKVTGSVKGGVGSVNHNGVLRSTKRHTQKLKAKSINKTKKKDTSGEKTRRFVHKINRRIESFFRNATAGKVGSGVGNVTGTVVKGGKTVGNNTINLVTKSNNKTQTVEKGKDSSNSKKKNSSGSKERTQTAKESTGKNSTTTKSS